MTLRQHFVAFLLLLALILTLFWLGCALEGRHR